MIETILLAEDDQDDSLIIRRAFEETEIAQKLIMVRDGEEVLLYLKGEPPFANRRELSLPPHPGRLPTYLTLLHDPGAPSPDKLRDTVAIGRLAHYIIDFETALLRAMSSSDPTGPWGGLRGRAVRGSSLRERKGAGW
jgi:hypothetical protein